MPEILLKQVDVTVDWTVTAEVQAPLDVYVDWANQLGVSPTDTLYDFSADDNSWSLTLAASPYLDSEVLTAYFSSEAGMGFYLQDPGSISSSYYSLNHVGRHYGGSKAPLLVLTWHPSGGDLKSYNTRFQRAGNVTIVFAQYSRYSSTATYRYDAALRIEPGAITLVGEAPTTVTPVYLTELTELQTSQQIQQYALLESQAIGTRRRYEIGIYPPKVLILAGVAKFSDGAVAELVRAWRRDTGALASSVVPDPVTGAFVMKGIKDFLHDVTIFRDGYRPLTHGPVQPFEVL